jgi:hypothetical protein
MTDLEIKTTAKIYERFNDILLPKRGTTEKELNKMQKEYEQSEDKEWISKNSLKSLLKETGNNSTLFGYIVRKKLEDYEEEK